MDTNENNVLDVETMAKICGVPTDNLQHTVDFINNAISEFVKEVIIDDNEVEIR